MDNHKINQEIEELFVDRVELEAELSGNDLTESEPGVANADENSDPNGSSDGQSNVVNRSQGAGDSNEAVTKSWEEVSASAEQWMAEQQKWAEEGKKFVAESIAFHKEYAPGSGEAFAGFMKKIEDKSKELDGALEQYQTLVDGRRFGNQWVTEIRDIISLVPDLKYLKSVYEERKKVYDQLCGFQR